LSFAQAPIDIGYCVLAVLRNSYKEMSAEGSGVDADEILTKVEEALRNAKSARDFV
jgi:hypothetical protein